MVRASAAMGTVGDILAEGGALARVTPDYEPRPAQLQLAERIAARLETGEGCLVVEAPTGVGKTLAYLTALVATGKRAVIATGTRTLQDQLLESELPRLVHALGHGVDAVALKGLSNYLCLRRFEAAQLNLGAHGVALDALRAWREASESGELRESGLNEDDALWQRTMSTTDTRIGPRCPHHAECFVTKARKATEDAQIIVTNHHLLAADLVGRLRHGNRILPDVDAIIVDEAHQLAETLMSLEGTQLGLGGIERLHRPLREALKGAEPSAQAALEAFVSHARAFFAELEALLPLRPHRTELDESLRARLHEGDAFVGLAANLAALVELKELQEAVRLPLWRSLLSLQHALLASCSAAAAQAQVHWYESDGAQRLLGTTPLDAAGFAQHPYCEDKALVLTSATLSFRGRMDYVLDQLGLQSEACESLALDSSFPLAQQCALYLPRHLPDPRDADYLRASTEEIRQLILLSGGATFVLCTSLRAMRAYAEALASLPFTLLLQGTQPRDRLLQRFREDGNAVLFGSQSFWEGIDVPGDALRLVIIDKLPFSTPSDPVMQARVRHVEARGEAPFRALFLPSAALLLKQAFGRLIRRATDRGVVAILDPRLARKSYGRVLVASLPKVPQITSLEALTEEAPRLLWRGQENTRTA